MDGFVDKKFYDENTKEPKLEDSLTWQDVKRIISMTTLPVIVKGILTGKSKIACTYSVIYNKCTHCRQCWCKLIILDCTAYQFSINR